MIRVTIYRDGNGHVQEFEMSGHAESGPYGQDLVCAGVSAVAFGSLNAVMSLCHIELNIDQGKDGGFLNCSVPQLKDERTKENVNLLLEGMLVSLQTIERDYGKYIAIEEQI
jgi:uncharacterized protein